MSNGSPQTEQNRQKSFRALLYGGLIFLFMVFFFGSLLKTHLVDPALGFWNPIFKKLFGNPDTIVFDSFSLYWFFLLFSFCATLLVAFTIGAFLNSRWFAVQETLFNKIPFLAHFIPLAQGSASAYHNLKEARSVCLRIRICAPEEEFEFFIPGFITKDTTVIWDKNIPIVCAVFFRSHTPTVVTGDTIFIPLQYMHSGNVIDIPMELALRMVVSGGIFGKTEKVPHESHQESQSA